MIAIQKHFKCTATVACIFYLPQIYIMFQVRVMQETRVKVPFSSRQNKTNPVEFWR